MKAANGVLLGCWYCHLCCLEKSCRIGFCPWVVSRAGCRGENQPFERGTKALLPTLPMSALWSQGCWSPIPLSSLILHWGRGSWCTRVWRAPTIWLCFMGSCCPGVGGRDWDISKGAVWEQHPKIRLDAGVKGKKHVFTSMNFTSFARGLCTSPSLPALPACWTFSITVARQLFFPHPLSVWVHIFCLLFRWWYDFCVTGSLISSRENKFR